MSDTVLIALFGLITVLIQTVGVILLAMVKKDQTEAAKKAETVATTLDEKNTDLNRKLNVISTQVQDVHVLTNHLKDELVKEVREASFAKGVKSETDKKE